MQPMKPPCRLPASKLGSLFALLLVVGWVPLPAQAGNHFLVEVSGGVSEPIGMDADTESGRTLTATLGFGGRFRGHAPAYYVVGRVGQSQVGLLGPPSSGRAHIDREQTEWAVGGRVYVPFFPRLRLLVELSLGEMEERSTVVRSGFRTLHMAEERFAVFAGSGLQFRLNDHFSLGAMANLAWMPSDNGTDLAASAAGIPDADGGAGRLHLGATATVHF